MNLGKLLALTGAASVLGLALASSISGCSSDDTPVTESPDARPDRVAVTTDAAALCYEETPVDATEVPYQPAAVAPNACTEANVADLVTWIKANPEASFTTLLDHVRATYSAACTACIVTEESAPSWGPIVTQDGLLDQSHGFINGAGCIEVASSRGTACGKAYHQWDVCLAFACQTCADDDAAYSECTESVQATACADASDALVSACGQQINNFIQACRGTYGIDAWMRRTCVLGAPQTDGGTDAGDAGDAGDAADADAATH